MLKLCVLILGLYLMIYGVSADGSGAENKPDEIPLINKNDYQVDFHRVELLRFDKRYMQITNIVTYKYNRTCPLVNATMQFLLNVGKDMEVITQLYKFASNEYRLFPMRFQLNFCQAWNKNVAGIADWSKCGNFKSCTPSKGINYTICNWTPNPAMFPPLIPNGDYKAELQFVYGTGELFVIDGYGIISRPIL